MALNFYPERADFTTTRSIGSEFASHLMTGSPVMARRELANSISGMLRPRGQTWMHARTDDEAVNKDSGARIWLDAATEHMRKYMYENKSGFVRSTKEGDNDWAVFGQTVLTIDLNQTRSGLLARCWHLKDCVWTEDETRTIDAVHRNWKIQARILCRLFPDTVSEEVRRLCDKEPLREINCRHVVMPIEEWDGIDSPKRRPKTIKFFSLYIDCDHEKILEEMPLRSLGYIIPRWHTISGSQYAYSPAAIIAMPDARMLQQISLTLLEAGQKSVDPPLIAIGEMIKGGINTFNGGITYVDADYDERTGEVLRPMTVDKTGLQWGNDREQKIRELITEAFYLNKINLPDIQHGDMTAYETQKRIEDHIRSLLPLLEPVEVEYNGALCDGTFELLLRNGAFGGYADMPPALRGQSIRFVFESPLQAASTSKNTTAFQSMASLLQIGVQIDPTLVHDVDVDKGFRDAAEGTGAPADWLVPPEKAEAAKQQAAQQQAMAQQAAQQAAQMQQVGVAADAAHKATGAAQNLGGALESLQQVGAIPGAAPGKPRA